jgi:Cysteine rich repeat
MRYFTTLLFSMAILFMVGATASAGESLIDTVAKGCEKELKTYCADVTPGQGRILACLYSHEDKLSAQCDFALYDAAAQLERAVAALAYVANECDEDLDKHCSSVEPGKGRLLDCLDKNAKKISQRCKEAIKDVGLK